METEQQRPARPERSGRRLAFLVLAPLALLALAWVGLGALSRERAVSEGRLVAQRTAETRRAVDRIDAAMRVLLTREAIVEPALFSSFVATPDAVLADGTVTTVRRPSPLLTPPEPGTLVRLYFELGVGGDTLAPARPRGPALAAALELGVTTRDQVDEAGRQLEQLERLVDLDRIRPNLRTVASGQELPSTYDAVFVPHRAGVEAGIELLLLRAGRRPETGIVQLQGVWLDWPRLREALAAIGGEELGGGAIELLPTLARAYEDRAPGLAEAGVDEGRLASLDAAIFVRGRAPLEVPWPRETALALAVAALFLLASLLAIHAALGEADRLAERRARFAAAVTHELRTPLTTLCMYTEMLDDGLVRGAAKRAEYVATLRREAERLRRVVDNVLAHAGLGGGEAARVEQHEAGALLEELAGPIARRAADAGAELVLRLAPAAGARVLCERAGLERILTNLVDNALGHGRPAAGGPDRAPRVTLSAEVADGTLALRVADEGPGIEPGLLARLFEPFARGGQEGAGDRASGGRGVGLGLGLALARDLARAMGGDLSLEPPSARPPYEERTAEGVADGSADDMVAGPGATLLLVLPLAPRAAAPPLA